MSLPRTLLVCASALLISHLTTAIAGAQQMDRLPVESVLPGSATLSIDTQPAVLLVPPLPAVGRTVLQDDSSSMATSESTAVTAVGEPAYSLQELEALALASNPALSEAHSRVEAARGRGWQAGLPPNPSAGYLANEMGNEGTAGQQGAYISQKFIRGGKLQLDRAIECREAQRLEEVWAMTQQRVLTDVRSLFYAILFLQQRQEIFEQFIQTTGQSMSIAQQLFDAGDNTRTDVLLAEIEYEQAQTDLIAVRADIVARWRELARVIGSESIVPGRLLEDDVSVPELTWQDALLRMQQSPQIAAAMAELARNQTALRRARVEPVPNLSTQFAVQYDYGTDDAFASVQIGMPIPVLNRNEGGIYAANAEVRAAMQKVNRLQLAIERTLAERFGEYQNALGQLQRIDEQIVPKATEVVKISLAAYQAGELRMPDVLNAQRSLLRAMLGRQAASRQLTMAWIEMEGFLLSNGLNPS